MRDTGMVSTGLAPVPGDGYEGDYWPSYVLKVSTIRSSIGTVPQKFKEVKKRDICKGD